MKNIRLLPKLLGLQVMLGQFTIRQGREQTAPEITERTDARPRKLGQASLRVV